MAERLRDLGFELLCTAGTAAYLGARGIETRRINKLAEGRPHVVDHLINGDVSLIVNTPPRRRVVRGRHGDPHHRAEVRHSLRDHDLGAMAAVDAIEALRGSRLQVTSLQELQTPTLAGR